MIVEFQNKVEQHLKKIYKNVQLDTRVDILAKDWMKSALVTDKTTAFLRYKDWADANYDWMRENSLEKFNGDKTARAKAFEVMLLLKFTTSWFFSNPHAVNAGKSFR